MLVDAKRPNREDLIKQSKEQPEAVVDLLLSLFDQVQTLQAEVTELKKNSRNSSKPPSSDKGNPNKPTKPKTKPKKKRRPGGQNGHKGSTLKMRDNPDHIIQHGFPSHCQHCSTDLSEAEEQQFERRHVFDIPPLNIEVTEHRVSCGQCPNCQGAIRGGFPDEVIAPVQYGSRIHGLVTYLGIYQMLPHERTSEFFADLFACPLSTGTVANILSRAGSKAEPVAAAIKEQIEQSGLFCADETGASLAGKNHWLHVAATSALSYFHFHPNRGFQALEDIGILPGYEGKVVHDFYSSYYRYTECLHYLCNAHHLRDLTYIHEDLKQPWAKEMIDLLLEAKKLRDRQNEGGRKVGPKTTERILAKYRRIIDEGYAINPEPAKIEGKRGRPKRGKALNFLDRLRDREKEVLGFFLEEDVPFDNNQAERDLRMIKAKLKISGCFRSPQAAQSFAQVRSVISTARKAGAKMLETLQGLFESPSSLIDELLSPAN